MSNNNAFYTIDELPTKIPLFMIRGAVLLPRAQITLPLFDIDQVTLLNDCLQKKSMLGLIQPNIPIHKKTDLEDFDLFTTGCVTRVVDLTEGKDSKLAVSLEGICRFKLIDQMDEGDAYPMATVDYQPFAQDLAYESDFSMDRVRLIKALKPYFDRLDITPNWEEIHQISNQKLITALSMACPLGPSEKQILLETESMKEQSEIMTKLIEMASMSEYTESVTYH